MTYGGCPVEFVNSDAYALEKVSSGHSAGLAAFWWSHVARDDLPRFPRALHARLTAGAPVFVVDNRYVEGGSTPISRRDGHGNTFQIRTLSDRSRHEVLKNFPDAGMLAAALDGLGDDLEFVELPCYWLARYRAASVSPVVWDEVHQSTRGVE